MELGIVVGGGRQPTGSALCVKDRAKVVEERKVFLGIDGQQSKSRLGAVASSGWEIRIECEDHRHQERMRVRPKILGEN